MQPETLSAYLSQLTGAPVSPDDPVILRSVQRAALVAWGRRQDPPIILVGLNAAGARTAREMLTGHPVDAPAMASPVSIPSAGQAASFGVMGVGIDIEDVSALPETHDYREHAFYQDNFTPTELAYCIRQADVRASLCGTWAAKEAVLKSGLLGAVPASLRSIEIMHDHRGRPYVPNGHLSISHSRSCAVAVCMATMIGAAGAAKAEFSPSQTPPAPKQDMPARPSYARVAALCGTAVAVIGGAVAIGLKF